jgi:hypothetical protein
MLCTNLLLSSLQMLLKPLMLASRHRFLQLGLKLLLDFLKLPKLQQHLLVLLLQRDMLVFKFLQVVVQRLVLQRLRVQSLGCLGQDGLHLGRQKAAEEGQVLRGREGF